MNQVQKENRLEEKKKTWNEAYSRAPNMKLTKEQFIRQFPYKADFSECEYKPVLDSTFEGVEVYRVLNLLVIKIGNDFYCRG